MCFLLLRFPDAQQFDRPDGLQGPERQEEGLRRDGGRLHLLQLCRRGHLARQGHPARLLGPLPGALPEGGRRRRRRGGGGRQAHRGEQRKKGNKVFEARRSGFFIAFPSFSERKVRQKRKVKRKEVGGIWNRVGIQGGGGRGARSASACYKGSRWPLCG